MLVIIPVETSLCSLFGVGLGNGKRADEYVKAAQKESGELSRTQEDIVTCSISLCVCPNPNPNPKALGGQALI